MSKPNTRTYQHQDQHPILRRYTVNLGGRENAENYEKVACEVTEFESDEGWCEWEDSVLEQNIEELVNTVPGSL